MEGRFKVIIVGGSIAGLTLAHCLDRLDIDFVVLEKRGEIDPQEGASVGIMPNGGRILEQLGLYDQIEDHIEPLEEALLLYTDGFRAMSRYPRLIHEQFGFPLAFLDRQKLLGILYNSLAKNTERVQTNQAVIRVEQEGAYVRVDTARRSFHGDLAVGADGVHSIVRSEMWRSARALGAGDVQKSEREMTVSYACVFGISSQHPHLRPGQQITCFGDGWSILSVVGKHGRIFWFLFIALEQVHIYPNTPRYSTNDAVFHCRRLSSSQYWETVSFGDIWDRREVFTMTPLEEGLFRKWSCQRMVCIGDSMHKFAPNIGQGANCAMEDAAALANRLHELVQSHHKKHFTPSSQDLDQALRQLTAERLQRLSPLSNTAGYAMRLQARRTIPLALFGRYILPYLGDRVAVWASRDIAHSVTLHFLPMPARSGPGWEAFKPKPRWSWVKILAAGCVMSLLVVWLGRVLT